jgi:hypothetical protein
MEIGLERQKNDVPLKEIRLYIRNWKIIEYEYNMKTLIIKYEYFSRIWLNGT